MHDLAPLADALQSSSSATPFITVFLCVPAAPSLSTLICSSKPLLIPLLPCISSHLYTIIPLPSCNMTHFSTDAKCLNTHSATYPDPMITSLLPCTRLLLHLSSSYYVILIASPPHVWPLCLSSAPLIIATLLSLSLSVSF